MDIKQTFNNLGINEKEYFLTGSRALDNKDLNYIISSDKSDYDYVVSIRKRHIILEYLQKNNIKIDFSCYNGGFKFEQDGKNYNIITVINIEFMAWRESLNILQHLIKTDERYRKSLSDKKVRYCIYEQLRGLCKSVITFGSL